MAPPASRAQVTLTKVTNGPVVSAQGHFTGFTWADFTGSGFLDLFVCDYGGTNVLYHNNGDGTFTSVTQGNPVQDSAYHVESSVADYDNDGALDLLVASGVDAPSAGHVVLYHNNGNGSFSAISAGGVANIPGFFENCASADYDNDGFVDMLITDDGDSNSDGGHNLLFHNNRDGTFSRVMSNALVSSVLDATGACWVDYDNDGFIDLFITCQPPSAGVSHNFLYHNNGDGTFTPILTNAVAKDGWPNGSWGSAWGDYDNDGLQDLFVTGLQMGNRLYHNNGNGSFSNITSGPMLSAPPGGGARSCAWGDYDNDGYLDLYVCTHDATNQLFHNNGDGTFTQILSGDPVNDGGPGIENEVCGWVDYDNDGFLDLFVNHPNIGGAPTSPLLYHNNRNSNAWLEVKLVGTVANRAAIGAKVRVHAAIGGKTFWQMREISGGSGRMSQPLVAHFGLGNATNVDTLRIEWPSGVVQTLTNVAPRQILTVVEHQPGVAAAPEFSSVLRSTNGAVNLSVTGAANRLYLLEASTNLVNWLKVGVTTNTTGVVGFTDSRAANYDRRFYRVSIP